LAKFPDRQSHAQVLCDLHFACHRLHKMNKQHTQTSLHERDPVDIHQPRNKSNVVPLRSDSTRCSLGFLRMLPERLSPTGSPVAANREYRGTDALRHSSEWDQPQGHGESERQRGECVMCGVACFLLFFFFFSLSRSLLLSEYAYQSQPPRRSLCIHIRTSSSPGGVSLTSQGYRVAGQPEARETPSEAASAAERWDPHCRPARGVRIKNHETKQGEAYFTVPQSNRKTSERTSQ
jgi:hypothetical protein